MIITSTNPDARVITDYDITFLNGLFVSIPVDEAAGDEVEILEGRIVFRLAGKPSPTDPSQVVPAEIMQLFTPNIIILQTRNRTVVPVSKEQKEFFSQTIKELSTKTVH